MTPTHLLLLALWQTTPPLAAAAPAPTTATTAAPVAGAGTAPVSLQPLVDRMQKLYDKTTSFSAQFEQSYTNKVFRRTETSRGSVSYQRPGLMRFDYREPSVKSFLVDGKALWIVQPADKQALVDRCFKADAMTTSLMFLFGQGKLAEQFEVAEGEGAPAGQRRLLLTPRTPQGAYQRLLLDVDEVTARVVASTVIDPQGNPNRFQFSAAQYSGTLDAKLFRFEPPAGMAVAPVPGSCQKAP